MLAVQYILQGPSGCSRDRDLVPEDALKLSGTLQDYSCRQQAEAMLMQLRHSPHAIAACQHILEHSSSAAAQFQVGAATAQNLHARQTSYAASSCCFQHI